MDQRLVLPGHYTFKVVLSHKPKPHKSSLSRLLSPAALKASLSQALTLLFPLAGRLKPRKGRPAGAVDVDCNDAGALFQDAEAEVTFEEVGGFWPKPEFKELLVPSIPDPALGLEQVPLLGVRVTRFRCGGATLVVYFHHGVGDAFSAAAFLTAWSALALGKEEVPLPPHHDRSLLAPRDPPRVTSTHPELTLVPPTLPLESAAVSRVVLDLETSHLAALKQRAALAGGASTFTAFEALMGVLWRSITRARGSDPASTVRLGVVTDLRKRMHPPLPPGYFGNAILGCWAETTAGELLEGGVSGAAECIHRAICKITDEHVRSSLDFFALQESPISVFDNHLPSTDADLVVTSWKGLPFYGAEFGMGGPDFVVGLPFGAMDGSITLMPGHRKEGGLSAIVCLQDLVLVKLKDDPEL